MSQLATRRSGRLTATTLALLMLAGLAPGATLAVAPTDAPELLSPTFGETVSANPVLSWGPVDGAAKYRIQISTASNFSALIYNVQTYNTSATPQGDLPLGTLYWRVAGIDEGSATGPYAVSNFEKAWQLAPSPIAPADGATLTFPDDPLLFTWAPLLGAKNYRLEVDDADDFVGASAYTTPNTSFTLTEPQTTGQTWYWRVQGVSATASVNSQWSATRSFEVEWPATPVLISPPNTTASSIQDVRLKWSPVVGAAKYQLQVSPNGDWANNVPIDVVVHGTSYSPPTGLNNGSFFWRVRARDARNSNPNNGGWSPEWQFTRGWPDRPTLLTPANGDFNVSTPTFSWTPVEHAAYYELEVDTDVNFSPPITRVCYTNHTSFTPYVRTSPAGGEPVNVCFVDLQPGAVYYWRVRGVDSPNKIDTPSVPAYGLHSNTSASDTFSFGYDPGIPDPTGPPDGSTVEVPVLTWEAVPGQGKYKVTISKATGGTITRETYATSYTPDDLDPAQGPFTWTVQTIDAFNKLGVLRHESEWWEFDLEPPATTYATPEPLAPADGSSSVRMPSMRWQPVTGAAYYRVFYKIPGAPAGTQLTNQKQKLAGFTYPGDVAGVGSSLPPGTYEWWVNAYTASDAFISSNLTTTTFTIEQFEVATYVSPEKCVPTNAVCTKLPDTPELVWDPVPEAGGYIVTVAVDADFTNVYRSYYTINTRLTPRESYLDNQAGQAYYWFVRPCINGNAQPCGPANSSVYPNAFAFQKRSAPIERLTPTNGATVENEITFEWRDFLATNGALAVPVTQEARQYRIQVSTVADFASIKDDKTVDQTSFAAYDRTYPEGPVYWRVQAIDGSVNSLTFSTIGSVTKASPAISLSVPANGATETGVPYFRWTPQAYAAQYELDIARNGDTLFSSTNRVFNPMPRTKMAAWAPLTSLAAGVYAWRVRRLDADTLPGPWSAVRTFTLQAAAPTLTSPANGAKINDNDLLFQWTAVPGAARYRFQLSTASSFSSTYESKETVMTSWAPSDDYPDGLYYWRVQMLDAGDNVLSTSNVRSFTKDATRPTVTAKSPTSNASITGPFDVTFSEPVTSVTAATFKMVIAGTTSAVAGTVSRPTTTTARFVPTNPLTPGESYTITLSSGIKDLNANPLITHTWTVRTALVVENTSVGMKSLWDRDTNGSASGSAYDASRTSGAKTVFTFTGTNVTLLGRRGADGGYADIYLDGVKQVTVSFYNATNQWQRTMWSKTGLTNAKHTAEVRVKNTKPAASTGTWVYVDAFRVGTVLAEETATSHRDQFRRQGATSASGGSYDLVSHLATGDNGGKPTFQLTFRGTGIDWYATKTKTSGTAIVYIDNTNRGTIDLYAATTSYNQKVYGSPTLADGVHTIKIVLTGAKQAAATGTDVSVDRLVVR